MTKCGSTWVGGGLSGGYPFEAKTIALFWESGLVHVCQSPVWIGDDGLITGGRHVYLNSRLIRELLEGILETEIPHAPYYLEVEL